MRGRTLFGIVTALVVVAGVATLAQDSSPAQDPSPPETVDLAPAPPLAAQDPPDVEPAADVLESPPAPGPSSVPDDPMEDVDGFIQRSREEAAGKIATLTEERERLRERLRKVEAALAKWSAVNEALERGDTAEVGPQELLPVEPSLETGDLPPVKPVPPPGVVVPPAIPTP